MAPTRRRPEVAGSRRPPPEIQGTRDAGLVEPEPPSTSNLTHALAGSAAQLLERDRRIEELLRELVEVRSAADERLAELERMAINIEESAAEREVLRVAAEERLEAILSLTETMTVMAAEQEMLRQAASERLELILAEVEPELP